MKQLLSEALEDCSTRNEFCFSLRCGNCAKVWHSTPIAFSKSGIDPPDESKRIIYNAVYQREKKYAKELAIKEGIEHFNLCPICQRLVCNNCFLMCDDLDICQSCANDLNVCGESVSEHMAADGRLTRPSS